MRKRKLILIHGIVDKPSTKTQGQRSKKRGLELTRKPKDIREEVT